MSKKLNWEALEAWLDQTRKASKYGKKKPVEKIDYEQGEVVRQRKPNRK